MVVCKYHHKTIIRPTSSRKRMTKNQGGNRIRKRLAHSPVADVWALFLVASNVVRLSWCTHLPTVVFEHLLQASGRVVVAYPSARSTSATTCTRASPQVCHANLRTKNSLVRQQLRVCGILRKRTKNTSLFASRFRGVWYPTRTPKSTL